MKQVKMRHPTRRFNFTPPGQPFTTNEDDVQYLIETYGCELVTDEPPAPVSAPVAAPVANVIVTTADKNLLDIKLDEPPVNVGYGWWAWQGEKFRRADLPAEAAELLE